MRRRLTSFFLIIVLFLTLSPAQPAAAQESRELNIYAMYLGNEEKGDSVLLESEGRCLLIDIGTASHAPAIVRQLNAIGATHVDILFSHLHIDHIGGTATNITAGLQQLNTMGITVDTLYLPAPVLTPLSQCYPTRYALLQSFMASQGSGQIVYLNVGDEIQLGDAYGQVIGPVDTYSLSPGQFTQLSTAADRYTRYENDCSLALIFTCGGTRYFTAGDCYGEEAASLVERYGDSLRCDIMKLNHHGIGTGNSAALLKAVQPSYSFAANTGVAETNSTTGRWRTYTALQRACKYGMCYLIGNEEKTLIFHIENDEITLYRGAAISSGTKMTGWQYLYGADGNNRDHDMYYLDGECVPVTGIQQIEGHYYRFTAGGQMDYGEYSSSGKYKGWKTYTNGRRYFKLSANGKYAYMSRGFDTVNGRHLYFDSLGYKVVSGEEDTFVIKKIGSYYYAVDFDGELTVDDWEEEDDYLYYFDSSGKMLRNQIALIDDEYYLFDTDGTLITGDSGTEFYVFKSNTYAIRANGTFVRSKRATINGSKYYFDSKGVMQKNKIITIGKKRFYFGKNGKMVTDRKFRLNGKTYYAKPNGLVTTKIPE